MVSGQRVVHWVAGTWEGLVICNHQLLWHSKANTDTTNPYWEKKGKDTRIDRKATLLLYSFSSSTPHVFCMVVADENMSNCDNSGMCLVHMLINPTVVSRAAGFAHQKAGGGGTWGGIGAGAAFRV